MRVDSSRAGVTGVNFDNVVFEITQITLYRLTIHYRHFICST